MNGTKHAVAGCLTRTFVDWAQRCTKRGAVDRDGARRGCRVCWENSWLDMSIRILFLLFCVSVTMMLNRSNAYGNQGD